MFKYLLEIVKSGIQQLENFVINALQIEFLIAFIAFTIGIIIFWYDYK